MNTIALPDVKAIRQCPSCGSALVADALEGLCPQCLLQAALETAPVGDRTLVFPATPPALPRSDPEALRNAVRFGDYELIQEIARGGMGVVWKARQISLNRIVAVKMILSGQFAGEAEVKRFRTEAEAAAQLQHPNIVAIHEIGENEGRHFFSMDFVQGQNMADLVGVKALEPEQAARYVKSIAEAVQFAHRRGVLHRDLKPQNVLIDADGRPRVTDFGLAKLTHGESSLTVSGTAMGSPSYMPPEQATGRNDRVGPASDVYSLGAILFELLTTRPPFLGATPLDIMKQVVEREPLPPRSLYPNVPADLDTICLKCLEKEPHRRYPTAQELADDLGRFLKHEPIRARPSTRRERAVKWVRRNPRVAGMGVVVLAVALIGFTAVWWQLQKTRAALRLAGQNAIAEATARAVAVPFRFVGRHSNEVVFAVFSPDGRQVLSASHDGTAKLWDSFSGQPVVTFTGHDGSLGPAQFSANGRRVLTFGGDTQNRFPHQTPDGRRMLHTSSLRYGDQTARLWDARTGRQLLLITNAADQLSSAALSPDGARVVTSSLDGAARIWDATDGRLLHTLTGHLASARSAQFSSDGRRVVTTSFGTKYSYKFERNGGSSSSGGTSMSLRDPFIAMFWDAGTGAASGGVRNRARQPLPFFGGSDDQQAVVISPFTRMVNIQNWPPPGELVPFHPARIYDATGREVLGLSGDGTGVDLVAFSPDGRKLLTASSARVRRAAITSGGGTRSGSSGSANNGMTAQLWNAKTGELLASMAGHESKLYVATFSPDGRRLLTGDSKRMYLWDTTTGKELSGFEKPSQAGYGSFSPDGQRILGNQWGTATLWDASTGRQLLRIKIQEGQVGQASFSPDGKRILLCGIYGSNDICDATTGQPVGRSFAAGTQSGLAVPPTRDAAIVQGLFSPDGRLVATLDAKGVVHLWDVTSRAPAAVLLATLRGHKAAVQQIAFSPDGRWLGTASKDYTAKLWPVSALWPGSPLAAASDGEKE